MMAKKEALKANCYWGEGEKEAALRLKGGYGSANWFFSLSNQDFAFMVIWKTLDCKFKKYNYMLFSTPVAMETLKDGRQTTFLKIPTPKIMHIEQNCLLNFN